MQQHLRKADPDVVQSEPAPMPPVVVQETDDGVGKLHVVVEFDENSTTQSRQAQNPYTVYGTSGHCSVCGRSGYNCLGQNGNYDVAWASVNFGGVNLGTVTKWTVTAYGAKCSVGTLSMSLSGTTASGYC
eukprot:9482284-Pyramimonas_sp.AAC.1